MQSDLIEPVARLLEPLGREREPDVCSSEPSGECRSLFPVVRPFFLIPFGRLNFDPQSVDRGDFRFLMLDG